MKKFIPRLVVHRADWYQQFCLEAERIENPRRARHPRRPRLDVNMVSLVDDNKALVREVIEKLAADWGEVDSEPE